VSREGRKYYVNSITQKTVWEQPEEYRLYMLYRESITTGSNVTAGASTATKTVSSSTADEQFWTVLRDRQVTGQWSWEETLRAIITHPNYKCIATLQERKASFERFCRAWEADAAIDARLQLVARKEAFKAMLAADTSIGPNSAWQDCVDKFLSHEAFKAITSNRERHELFDEHVTELRRIHAQERAQVRKSNMDTLKAWMLSELKDLERARWSSIRGRALERQRELEAVEPVDALVVFEDVFDELSKQYEANRDAQRLADFESEARAKKSLSNQLDQKVVSPFASWAQVSVSLDKEDLRALAHPRFHLASQPQDLFKEVLSMRRAVFLKEYTRFYQYCHDKFSNGPLPRMWTKLGDFVDDLRHKFPVEFLTEVHPRLFKTKDEKAAIADYKHLLKHWTRPTITLESSWREVREALKAEPAFSALADDLRESYFYKYLKYLKSKQ